MGAHSAWPIGPISKPIDGPSPAQVPIGLARLPVRLDVGLEPGPTKPHAGPGPGPTRAGYWVPDGGLA